MLEKFNKERLTNLRDQPNDTENNKLAEGLAAQSDSKNSWSCTCYELYYGFLDLHISHFTNSPEFM